MRRLILLLLNVVASPCFAQTYREVDAFLDAFFAKDAKTLSSWAARRRAHIRLRSMRASSIQPWPVRRFSVPVMDSYADPT